MVEIGVEGVFDNSKVGRDEEEIEFEGVVGEEEGYLYSEEEVVGVVDLGSEGEIVDN